MLLDAHFIKCSEEDRFEVEFEAREPVRRFLS